MKRFLSMKHSKKIVATLCAVFMLVTAPLSAFAAANSTCPNGSCRATGTLVRQYDKGTECSPNAASPCKTRWVSEFKCSRSVCGAQWTSCQYCGKLR